MKSHRFYPAPAAAVLLAAFVFHPLHAETSPNKPVVEGTFLGDGKDAKIKYLTVLTQEPFNDKPAIRLIFTEKNPATSKDPAFDAGFKKLGNALLLRVFRDGGIFGCEVAHTAHEKSPFSALGAIKMSEFEVTDSTVSGRVTTNGEQDAFGQKWSVDLKFSAPLPKDAFAAVSEPAPAPKEEDPEPTGPKLPVAELALPSSAREVQFRGSAEQIAFASDAPVQVLAQEFSKALKKQGWKQGPGQLVTKNSAILKLEREGASLTIMAKPQGKGSTVNIITTGLDWSETPASAETKPAEPAKIDDMGAEANRLINDALKQVPAGLR